MFRSILGKQPRCSGRHLLPFLRDNSIRKGIIVADKGFPLKNMQEELDRNRELHYLLLLKRDSKLISSYDALAWDSTIHFGDRALLCRKIRIDGERYLQQKKSFGTIVFISDLDLSEKEVYRIYCERWLLELMFVQYKRNEGLSATNVQGDFSIIGEEFVNFIATILKSRLAKKADETRLLDTMSCGELMDDLSSAWRSAKGESVKPKDNDRHWIHTLPSVMDELVKLEITTCTKEKRSPGRPRKEKPVSDAPRNPRGRARKNP